MRNALNNNPVVQAVVIGIMALAVAFLLFTRVLSGGEEPGEGNSAEAPVDEPAAPATGAASAETPAATSEAPAAEPSAPPATSEPAPAAPATPAGDVQANFIPGPGLPEEVVVAYAQNKAVVLLIENDKGLDDAAVRKSVAAVGSRSDVELILVADKDVADYARVTEGLNLNRTPAIVVIRPRKLTNNVPEATVSYGFRGPDSVNQAVEDALFDGKNVTYDP